jgi:hypothetical protein
MNDYADIVNQPAAIHGVVPTCSGSNPHPESGHDAA